MTAPLVPADVLAALAENANAADSEPIWPAASWDVLRRAGVLSWNVPREYGGRDLSAVELLQGYGQLASACLTTTFILSQREAAVRRIIASENQRLCAELLPPLARGEGFTTVGLSQLTTARQHGPRPALTVREAGSEVVFDGYMPWVTGAERADYFITGAVLESGEHILAVLHRALPGVSVQPPMELMALEGSLTTEVQCSQVVVDRSWVLKKAPAGQVMTGGRGGAGGLETSCLALGLAAGAIDYLLEETATRAELAASAQRLDEACRGLRKEMYDLAAADGGGQKAVELRGKANALVLQATQVALTAAKGHGFVRGHPAQRWARQAMFFLVWSCPRAATEATLAHLTPAGEHEGVCL